MLRWLTLCLLLARLAEAVPAGLDEPLPRHESNVSIRHEVQMAIDKGLAHLEKTQRDDGSWGKPGVTGFSLMAFEREPRGRYRSGEPVLVVQKGCAALQHAILEVKNPQTMDDFAWNMPPAVLALRSVALAGDPRNEQAWIQGYRSLALRQTPIGTWDGNLPAAPEDLALYQAAWEQKQFATSPAPQPAIGSATSAWIFSQLDRQASKEGDLKVRAAVAQLGEIYTLDRNPNGEGIHRYYFWLTLALMALDSPDLTLADGRKVDVARQLAEKLINDQNADGSWSGVGEHSSEKDPVLVTSYCLLALEAVYRLL